MALATVLTFNLAILFDCGFRYCFVICVACCFTVLVYCMSVYNGFGYGYGFGFGSWILLWLYVTCWFTLCDCLVFVLDFVLDFRVAVWRIDVIFMLI